MSGLNIKGKSKMECADGSKFDSVLEEVQSKPWFTVYAKPTNRLINDWFLPIARMSSMPEGVVKCTNTNEQPTMCEQCPTN